MEEFQITPNDASVLTDSQDISEYFEEVVLISKNPKASANWVMGPVKSVLNDQNLEIGSFPVPSGKLAEIIKLIDEEKINQNMASKQLFPAVLSYPERDLDSFLEEMITSVEDVPDLEGVIRDVIKRFPGEAEMLRNGKKKLIGMFMGQVMKATNGSADPKKAQKILLETLQIK